ncbi:MAG: PorT family protein [Bacteroidales bacterium]|nr:PorT family protein [Bacteroidales bacterium]
MKKFIAILFTSLVFAGFSQRTGALNLPKYDYNPLHFGFTLALNSMDFTIRNSGDFFTLDSVYSIENKPHVGFNLNIVSDLRISENLTLRFLPGLDFGQRDMEYIIPYSDTSLRRHVMKIESIFLDFPLEIKYRAQRISNYRPYLLTGVAYKFDLAAQKKVKEEEKPKNRLVRSDVYYEFGFGVDYYLPYFKFSTELKFAVGIFDILKRENSQFTKAIERMNSKMIVLSFHFE